MKSNRVDQLNRSPIHLLHRASQAVEDLFTAEVKMESLTPRQLLVLMTVAQNEGLSQTGIVDRTGIDRSTLADIVRRMQRKGLLQRRRTREDARAYAVKLTDEGKRVLRSAEPLAKKVDERILDALSTKQRDQFIDDLLAIVDTLQKMSPQGKHPLARLACSSSGGSRRRASLVLGGRGSFFVQCSPACRRARNFLLSRAICSGAVPVTVGPVTWPTQALQVAACEQ
jgi:DNA-binding MarR family transcriptional regulator